MAVILRMTTPVTRLAVRSMQSPLSGLPVIGSLARRAHAPRVFGVRAARHVPHDAWCTAFHKFEVVYNSLFWGNLEKTNNGEIISYHAVYQSRPG